jgi:hypothetical protein
LIVSLHVLLQDLRLTTLILSILLELNIHVFSCVAAYYYPTAKKRYLPRIQKVTEEIISMPEAIAGQDWAAVAAFGKVAENAVLPLQLYVSSLDGQGLSMANSYAKQMKIDALAYEKA